MPRSKEVTQVSNAASTLVLSMTQFVITFSDVLGDIDVDKLLRDERVKDCISKVSKKLATVVVKVSEDYQK